jgi:two-component system chemotaxis response regulator CheY
MRALVVDDSRVIRTYVRELLEHLGVSVSEAEDGGRAIDLLSDLRVEHTSRPSTGFDLMLLDVNMPVMNGLDCVRLLRRNRLAPAMKVMMVTTEADHSLIDEALCSGADEFLMKPFSPQSLREKLTLLGFEMA